MTTATKAKAAMLAANGFTIADLMDEYRVHLAARNRSRETIGLYLTELRKLHDYLTEVGMPTDIGLIRREHLEAYIVALRERGLAEHTVSLSYRSLTPFFKWLVATDELKDSPMAKMEPPKVHVVPKAIPPRELAQRLVATCDRSFEGVRDRAIIAVLTSTGIRRGELVNLRLQDVDAEPPRQLPDGGMSRPSFRVTGKARTSRGVGLIETARLDLKRYLAKRQYHPKADSDALWLGPKGPLTGSAILQMLRRRGRLIGEPMLGPHMFRRGFAHQMLEAGMNESDIMQLAGWKGPEMLQRYAGALAEERAIDGHHRFAEAVALRKA